MKLLLWNLSTVLPGTAPLQGEAPPAGDSPGTPAGETGAPFGGFLVPMLAVLAIFYFVMFLPERKKQKQRTAMLEAMKKGDKVMTSAGLYGTVTQIQDDVITLQVADAVRLRFNRAAIQTVLDAEGKAAEDAKDTKDAKG